MPKPMPKPLPAGVTTTLDETSVSATAVVDAPPADVFDFLRRPANHPEISGDHSVRHHLAGRSASGSEVLGPASTFRMAMVMGVPYRMSNKVVEFDEDRVIAWRHVGGHRWRWVLEPAGEDRTRVTETFDQSTSRVPWLLRRLGYPKGHLANVADSVANVAAHFAAHFAARAGTRAGSHFAARAADGATEGVDYDELAYLAENAAEFGLPFDAEPVVRRVTVEVAPGHRLSALQWGVGDPQLVLVHGGAQNAHTWDTVALALDRPLLAIDLPGHGHSDAPSSHGQFQAESLAPDVAEAIAALAPQAAAVVGMSLGGLTSMLVAATRPELVRRLVLVDITPGVDRAKAKAITDFVRGPATFASFDEILARTIEHNPTRSESSLRRGIVHNAEQLADGSWRWRYRRFDASFSTDSEIDASARLWDALGSVTVPVLFARGMRPQSVVDDADEAELLRRLPGAEVAHFAEAGHSIQGDMPVELAAAIAAFVDGAASGQ